MIVLVTDRVIASEKLTFWHNLGIGIMLETSLRIKRVLTSKEKNA